MYFECCRNSSLEHPAWEVSMKDTFVLLLPRDFSGLSEGGSSGNL